MMRRVLLVILGILFVVFTKPAFADDDLSVSLHTPENQREGATNQGYADLLTKPGEVTKLTFEVTNNTNESKQIAITGGTAGTSENGTIVYASKDWPATKFSGLSERMENLIVPSEGDITVGAKETRTTTVDVKTPENGISGILAGGVSFVPDTPQISNRATATIPITTEVGYTIAIFNRTSNAILVPDLSIGAVTANLTNSQSNLSIQLANNTATFLNDLYLSVSIDGPEGINLQRTSKNMQMAPNTKMTYRIWTNGQPLHSGSYDVQINAYYGRKDNLRFDAPDGNRYTYHTHGQTTLKISAKQANDIAKNDALMRVKNQIPMWLAAVLVVVVIALVAGLAWFMLRRRSIQFMFVLSGQNIIERGTVQLRWYEQQTVLVPHGYYLVDFADETAISVTGRKTENTYSVEKIHI